MKNITFIIAMLVGSICWGQKKDSLQIKGKPKDSTSIVWYMNGDTGSPAYSIGKIIEFEAKQDTVKVLLLVCDTLVANVLKVDEQTGIVTKIGGTPRWQFGYEVIVSPVYDVVPNPDYWGEGRTCLVEGCTLDHSSKTLQVLRTQSYRQHLDENKKRLSPSLVVWMSKEIK